MKSISLLVSSDTDDGAINVNSLGSEFKIRYDTPLIQERNIKNVNVALEKHESTFVFPNILEDINDKITITDTGVGSGTAFGPTEIQIPEGLYSRSQLSSALNLELYNAGAASSIVALQEDLSTQKVIFIANFVGITVDLTATDTFRDIIGFNSQTLGPSTISPTYWTGDNVAAFNTITSLLFHSDICDAGIPVNSTYSNILDQILINATPGKQIIHDPFNPPFVSANKLINSQNTTYKFWLTDQNNDLIDTLGEKWTGRLKITYET
jgi:hypothetical protein